jgi:hypothetical protein
MNIIKEKEKIIRLISEEHDETVIYAVKDLLESAHDTIQPINDEALERELDISIKEADNGEELPYEEVAAKLRKKYAA